MKVKKPLKFKKGYSLKYIYKPDLKTLKSNKAPAVLILHEITGIAKHTKRVAQKFTDAGYIAVTPNLFEDKRIQKIFKEMPHLFEKAQKEGNDLTKLNKKISEKISKIDKDLYVQTGKTFFF